ncbi:hypothetical protein ACFQRC_04410 [Enterovirga sp. GCM10030262]|uniref:hypothetical protein n=1 Tax=Enterovirga sp. GCM10030262 TaxID=3273391 RepID=UPI00361EE679
MKERERGMGVVLRSIEKQLPEIAAQCAEVRRERNRSARRRRREAQGWAIEARRLEAQTRAKLIRADRELERLLRFRIRIRPEDRPKLSGRTARKLYDHAERLIGGIIGTSDVRGRDGLYSLYFGWRSRGLGAQDGRAWRPGEAARFVRYITRETALEAGEDGWFSNIGEDREELVAFFRALENVERADRDNANVYISVVVPLPYDLDAAGRRRVAGLITDALAVRGLPFVAALHLPDPGGDQRNFHLHVQLSLRPFERHGPCDWTFSAAKQAQLNTGAGIALMKRHAIRQINRVLAQQGIERRYSHRPRTRRGEGSGEMKRRRGATAREKRVALLEDIHTHWARLREHALSLRDHLSSHAEQSARLSQAKARNEGARLRQVGPVLEQHRLAAGALAVECTRLRMRMQLRTSAARLAASLTWRLPQRQRLTAAKSRRDSRRRVLVAQAQGLLLASAAGLTLQRDRLDRLRSWSETQHRRSWAKGALAQHRAALAVLRSRLAPAIKLARTRASAVLRGDVQHAKPLLARHRVDWLAANALYAEIRLRVAMSHFRCAVHSVRAGLDGHAQETTQLRIRAAGLKAKRDPARRVAIQTAVAQVDSLGFISLTRAPGANGGFNYRAIYAPAKSEDPDVVEAFATEKPVQAAYERKWNAMIAALDSHLEQNRECPFEFAPDRIKLNRAGLEPDLFAAILAANNDREIQAMLQHHATRWVEIEAARAAARKKKAAELAKAQVERAPRVQLVIERINAPERPGTFSDRAVAAIRQDVRDLSAALTSGELALQRDGESFVFRSNTAILADATVRLFSTAAGRAAVELLHRAVAGHQPHADDLAVTWTRRPPGNPATPETPRAQPKPATDISAGPWKKPQAEIGD